MSTNHTIRLFRPDEKKWHCGAHNCLNTSTHECSYDYTTGRSGRVTTAHKCFCRQHAQGFQQKYDAKHISNQVVT